MGGVGKQLVAFSYSLNLTFPFCIDSSPISLPFYLYTAYTLYPCTLPPHTTYIFLTLFLPVLMRESFPFSSSDLPLTAP